MAGRYGIKEPKDADEWARGLEKRLLHEERRPAISTAQELLGPGFGPFAVQLLDWNADEAVFTGFWYTEPGALNTPDPNSHNYYLGSTICIGTGFGIQRVTQYREADIPDAPDWEPNEFVRRFSTVVGTNRSYSDWRLVFGVEP